MKGLLYRIALRLKEWGSSTAGVCSSGSGWYSEIACKEGGND